MHAFLVISPDPAARDGFISAELDTKGVSTFDRIIAVPEQTATVGISVIRKFIAALALSPGAGLHTAGIIPDAGLLSPAAQQALLKTLEEPPEGAYIYIGTSSDASVLPTIVSRCECVTLKPAPETDTTDGNIRNDIDTLMRSGPGRVITVIAGLKTREETAEWTDAVIRLLRLDVIASVKNGTDGRDVRTKRRILRRLTELRKYRINNVSAQLSAEAAFLDR